MEQEENFLFVGFQTKSLPSYIENGKEVLTYIPVLKRATIRKPSRDYAESEGMVFKRTQSDFDPMGKQIGYVVILHTKVEDKHSVVKQDFHFPAITETAEESDKIREELLKGSYKEWLVKGQKLDKIEVQPVLISHN